MMSVGSALGLKDRILEICRRDDGVDLVGVASVERLDGLPAGQRPGDLAPGARSVIVLGSQLFEFLTERLTASRKVGEVSMRDVYDAHVDAVNADLRQTAYRVARCLTAAGYPSLNLSHNITDNRTLSPAFPFKRAAVASGLGAIGRNGLIITPAYGPRVRLAAVVTSAELEEDPLLEDDPCTGCNLCIEACPSGALRAAPEGERVSLDRFACSTFISANHGCGLCMSRCPK